MRLIGNRLKQAVRRVLGRSSGAALLMVLCVGALFIGLSAALAYAASQLSASAQVGYGRAEQYRLAATFSRTLSEQLGRCMTAGQLADGSLPAFLNTTFLYGKTGDTLIFEDDKPVSYTAGAVREGYGSYVLTLTKRENEYSAIGKKIGDWCYPENDGNAAPQTLAYPELTEAEANAIAAAAQVQYPVRGDPDANADARASYIRAEQETLKKQKAVALLSDTALAPLQAPLQDCALRIELTALFDDARRQYQMTYFHQGLFDKVTLINDVPYRIDYPALSTETPEPVLLSVKDGARWNWSLPANQSTGLRFFFETDCAYWSERNQVHFIEMGDVAVETVQKQNPPPG